VDSTNDAITPIDITNNYLNWDSSNFLMNTTIQVILSILKCFVIKWKDVQVLVN
jgi:hypothetical protein